MFVCLGNICRSPMAELLLKDMVKKEGREGDFIIESSATAHENVVNGVGAPVYYHIRTLLEGKGISCAEKRAQVLKRCFLWLKARATCLLKTALSGRL